jgi:hypothetical protein
VAPSTFAGSFRCSNSLSPAAGWELVLMVRCSGRRNRSGPVRRRRLRYYATSCSPLPRIHTAPQQCLCQ